MKAKKTVLAVTAAAAAILLAACSHAGPDSHGTPDPTAPAASADAAAPGHAEESDGHDHDHEHGHGDAGFALDSSAMGYSLDVPTPTLEPMTPATLEFTITGEDGAPVTEFEIVHEKPMHVALVAKNFTSYMHVHPELDAAGTWSVDLPALDTGVYRMVAGFTATEHPMPMALGVDLTVGGESDIVSVLEESRTSTSGGYTAELVGDSAHEGKSAMKVVLTKDGKPVTDVDPYLGAGGHFVAFSSETFSYAHAHPNGLEPDSSGALTFTMPALNHETWRGYVEVNVGGSLRTFEFTWVGE